MQQGQLKAVLGAEQWSIDCLWHHPVQIVIKLSVLSEVPHIGLGPWPVLVLFKVFESVSGLLSALASRLEFQNDRVSFASTRKEELFQLVPVLTVLIMVLVRKLKSGELADLQVARILAQAIVNLNFEVSVLTCVVEVLEHGDREGRYRLLQPNLLVDRVHEVEQRIVDDGPGWLDKDRLLVPNLALTPLVDDQVG